MAITKVTTDVITDSAVTAPKLAADSVITAKIADNAVTAAKIAAGALGDQVAGISSSASATTIAGTLASTGVLTANAGVVVDNITIDGTEIDLSSGDLTLDVAGDIILDADGGDVIFRDGGTSFITATHSSGDVVLTSNVDDKDIIFKGYDSGSLFTAMTIDMSAGGSVGIGTTSPFGQTQISDTDWSSGAPYGTVLTVTGNNTNDANWGHLLISDSSTGTGNGGMLRFATGSTSSDMNPFAGIDSFTEGSAYGGLKFLTRPNGGTATARMTITSSGDVLVGTTNTDIGGSVTGIKLRPTGAIQTSIDETGFYDQPIYADRRGTNNTGNILALAMNGFFKASIGIEGTSAATDDAVISFNTIHNNNTKTERMRIESSGNVGIGETSPSTLLHLGGTAPGDSIIRQDSTSSGTNWEIGERAAGKWQIFEDDGDSIVATFKSTGDVGIGEESPAARLHVEHSSGTAYDGAAEPTESLIVSNKAGTDNSGVNNVASIGLHVADGATSQGFINYVRSANNQGYFTLSQRTAATTYEEQFTLDREGQAFIKGTSPYMQIRDTTAGGGAGNGGQVIMSGHHAGSSDGFREFAKIVGVKQNSTGGDTHGYLGFYTNQGAASTTEGMRLNHDGKLTVGSTPSQSNGIIEANYTGNAFTLWLTTTAQNYLGFESTETGGQAWSFRTAGTGTYGSANGDLLFVNGSGGIFMRMDQSAGTVNGDFNDTSDIGLKKNIKDTTDGLDALLKLKARKFDWKDENKRNDVNGFIAQEVETVLPNEVIGDDYNEEKPEHGNKSINTSGLLAVAVKAIQEQQTIIDDLKARIETLEG